MLVAYCAMKGKTQQEYAEILQRVKYLAGLTVFQAKIVSTDQEFGMINAIRENYSIEVLFKNCSFHWLLLSLLLWWNRVQDSE